MDLSSAPGVFDIIPFDEKELWRSSYLWNYVERKIREVASEWGFEEIRTPIFERTELFLRGVGEGTDIVSKEMYTFQDKGERSLTLRPEGTAAAMRAILERRLLNASPLQKIFYIAPMFRYERAQAGRYRQHHQFGVEAIGVKSPYQDAEVIDLIYTLYGRLGIQDLQVQINSLGDQKSRAAYKETLIKYLESKKEHLSKDSQTRLHANPLRVLDSKAEEDKAIVKEAPSILDFLDDEALKHFELLQKLLSELKIPFVVNPRLVRGLDYYNYTVFEVVTNSLGAQNSLAGGGRYDGLIKSLGGPDLPAFGFGTGMERVIQTMIKQSISHIERPKPTIVLIPLGDAAREKVFQYLHKLREKGIHASMELMDRKLGKSMSWAEKIRADYVAVIGETELQKNAFRLKVMETGDEIEMDFDTALRMLALDSKTADYHKLWTEFHEPLKNDTEKEFFLNKIQRSIKDADDASENLKIALHKMQDLIS